MGHTLFATHSSKLIDYTDIREEDICLEDIAHHLTNVQRFGGALPLDVKYSVASHSLNCYQMAKWLYPKDLEVQRLALMHDATEAYLGDVVSGLKHILPLYKAIEEDLHIVIMEKYSLSMLHHSHVDRIDKRMMLTEVVNLMPEKYTLYINNSLYTRYKDYNNLNINKLDSLVCLPYWWQIKPDKYPGLIKQLFLKTCEEIGIRDA